MQMTERKMKNLFDLLIDLGCDTLDYNTDICMLKFHTEFGVMKFRIKFEPIEEEEKHE